MVVSDSALHVCRFGFLSVRIRAMLNGRPSWENWLGLFLPDIEERGQGRAAYVCELIRHVLLVCMKVRLHRNCTNRHLLRHILKDLHCYDKYAVTCMITKHQSQKDLTHTMYY